MKASHSTVMEAVFQAGLDEDSVREDYSGRYMYGRTAFGIVGSWQDFGQFLIELATQHVDGYDLASEFNQRLRVDDMANEYIFYFPGITLVEKDDNEDE